MRSHVRVALLATVVEFGGIERVLLTLLRHIPGQVKLCPIFFTRAGKKRNAFLEMLDAYGISYQAIHVDTSRFKYLNPIRNICETIARVKAGGFDVIHSHGYRADLIGFVAARRFGLPIVSTCHGFISTDAHLRIYNRLDTYLLRHFSRVIAVSERMKADLVARGVDGEKIQVITNAVEKVSRSNTEQIRRQTRARLGIAEEEFIVGFVGRLSEEKGLRYLLDAARRWAPKEYRWRLLLIGDGPQRGMLEQVVRNFELADKVLFVGFQRDTAEWYPAMDAFVLPSLMEGTPMVLLEAMANGIPVIATSVGGVSAMISSGRHGILVPPADALMLLDAMQTLVSDRGLRERLRINAVQLIHENHSVDWWVEQMTQAYVTTLRQCRRA